MAEFHSQSSSLETPTFSALVLYVNQETQASDITISRVTNHDQQDEDGVNNSWHFSFLALLLTLFKKSIWASSSFSCKTANGMETGWPTDVRHVAHVTFDQFNGFLGLPVEFEPHVPRRPPSASTKVFGVSTESMHVSYDSRGNSIPTILIAFAAFLV